MESIEAVLQLRTALHMTQVEFAKAAGFSHRSLCRFEAGRKPGPIELKKLANLAKANGQTYLYSIFDAMLQSEVISRAERRRAKLRSPGTARQIPLDELIGWEAGVEEMKADGWETVLPIVERLKKQLSDSPKPVKQDLDNIRDTVIVVLEKSLNLLNKMGLYSSVHKIVLGPNVEVRVSEDKPIVYRVKSDPAAAAAATKAYEAAGERLRSKSAKPAKTKKPRKPKD